MITGANGTSMGYDISGRLVEYNTSVSTRFVYDGSAMIAEVSNPAGAILRRYVHGPGTDEPIVWYEGSGTTDRRFLQADERGSIVAITDSAGAKLGINSYDEFGIPAATNIGRFGYTGQTWFPELGLANYKARWYSPTLGRFLQTDPIGYADGLNWYNYVGSDPVNAKDPTGTDSTEIEVRGIIHGGGGLGAGPGFGGLGAFGGGMPAGGPGGGSGHGNSTGTDNTDDSDNPIVVTGTKTQIFLPQLPNFSQFAPGLGGGLLSDVTGNSNKSSDPIVVNATKKKKTPTFDWGLSGADLRLIACSAAFGAKWGGGAAAAGGGLVLAYSGAGGPVAPQVAAGAAVVAGTGTAVAFVGDAAFTALSCP